MSVNFHSRYAVYAVVATIGLIGAAVSAQQAAPGSAGTAQAALIKDVSNLSDKFVDLARVMSGKYDWRPMPGVRIGERRLQLDRHGKQHARRTALWRSSRTRRRHGRQYADH